MGALAQQPQHFSQGHLPQQAACVRPDTGSVLATGVASKLILLSCILTDVEFCRLVLLLRATILIKDILV